MHFGRRTRPVRISALMLPVLALPMLLGGCSNCNLGERKPPALPASDEVTSRQRDQMSTYVTISVAAPESDRVLSAIDAAFNEIDRLESILSEWNEQSEIARINAEAGERPVEASDVLFELIKTAQQISANTDGAFDITTAAMHGVWDFRSLKPNVPSDEAIAKKLRWVDYSKLQLDESRQSIYLPHSQMRIGLSGIAKGYIVDRASELLTRLGLPNHLIVAGGDLYAAGHKASRPWKVGIRDPNGVGVLATLAVEDRGAATSGNYERYFVKDGVRYHHILDPRTGRPARGVSSVTVTAPSAMAADAYATGLFVLGIERGVEVARKTPGIEALLFDDAKFAPYSSSGMDAVLEMVDAPAAPD